MPDDPEARYAGSLRIAWAGAALFGGLAALVAAYSYAVRVRSPAAPAARWPAAVARDVALFAIFALHHSLFARLRLKAAWSRRAPPELERSIYTWVASLLFIAVCAVVAADAR